MEQNLDNMVNKLVGAYPRHSSITLYTVKFKKYKPKQKHLKKPEVNFNISSKDNEKGNVMEGPRPKRKIETKSIRSREAKVLQKNPTIPNDKNSSTGLINISNLYPDIYSKINSSNTGLETSNSTLFNKQSLVISDKMKEAEATTNICEKQENPIKQRPEKEQELDIEKLRNKVIERKRRRSSKICISNSPIKGIIENIPREGSSNLASKSNKCSVLYIPSSPVKFVSITPHEFSIK